MKKRNSRRRRKGLTLMEVMLVLVILGILGSMAAIFISGAQKDAMRKTTATEISTLIFGTRALPSEHVPIPNGPRRSSGVDRATIG